jgi:histidinol-phosphate aminotransferase
VDDNKPVQQSHPEAASGAGLVKECVLRIRPYRPGKPVEEVEREYGISNAVKLASNENPLGPSPRAVAAMQETASRMAFYPEDTCYYLKRELASRLEVPEEWLILGNGSDEVLHCAGLAFLSPGDEVIQADITFVMYETNTHLHGATPVVVPLKNHTYDLEAMAGRFSDRTKLVFIANPNNPTGTYVTQAQVDAFMDALPPHVLAVFDEAYFEYVDAPDYPDALKYVRAGRNCILTRTFSKIYGLAGLRVGYGVAPPHIAAYLHQVRPPFNVNSMAQVAALASLEDPEQVERSRRANSAGKRLLCDAFDRMRLPYAPTQANFVWVDVKADSRAVFEGLLRLGVIVRTGDIFGTPTFLRVTIGVEEQNARFLEALDKVLASLKHT